MIGSKWFKIDFHTHTPASADFGNGDLSQKSIKPDAWLKGAMCNGLDALVVTDHNSGMFVDLLKNELAKLDALAEKPEWYRPLLIFPGVEITVGGGLTRIHALGVFDPSTTTQDIMITLALCGITTNFGDQDHCSSSKGLPEVLKIIRDRNGVPILAHVDKEKGLLFGRDALDDELKASLMNAAALQVCSSVNMKNKCDQKIIDRFAIVAGSDAHEIGNIGAHYVWLKMGEPTIKGLAFALQDKEFCVLPEGCKDPNLLPSMYIKSISILNLSCCGRGASGAVKVEFSHRFSSLIGGRGAGKSTILESLRLVFAQDQNVIVPDEMRTLWNNFREGMVLPDSLIVTEFCSHGTLYKLKWNASDEGPTLEEFDTSRSEWIPIEAGDIASRFSVGIYSQKQLFALANNPRGLLAVIDAAIGREAWDRDWERVKSEYVRLCMRARELRNKVADIKSFETKIGDLDKKIAEYQGKGYGVVLNKYQSFKRQQSSLNVKEEIDGIVSGLTEIADRMTLPDFPELAFADADDHHREEMRSSFDALKSVVANVETQARSGARGIESAWERYVSLIDGSDWNKARQLCNIDYEKKAKALKENGDSFDLELYDRWVAERAKLAAEFSKLGQVTQEQERVLVDLREHLDELKNLRAALSKSRSDFINSVLGGNEHVQMSIIPFGDTKGMDKDIRNILGIEQDRFMLSLYSEENRSGLLSDLINWERSGTKAKDLPNMISELKSKFWGVAHGKPSGYQSQFDKRIVNIYELEPFRINELSAYWPEDKLEIRYFVGKKAHELRNGSSPGQKSAAVLAFLLSYGESPLVLDQPEDDLDNHLIMDLVVRQIRLNKVRRQLIIATHNPNIVVNGDAEWVCALKFAGEQIRIASQASLDNEMTRNSVCRIMEGGAEALQKRYNRMLGGYYHV